MRSVGCGLLLLSLLTFRAVGQTPGTAPWPSLDEARSASACDTTRWAKTIAEIKAAEPERDAEQQVAGGNISLKRLKEPRSEVGTSRERQFILPRIVETFISPPDGTLVEITLVDGRTFGIKVPLGVVCHPDLPVEEAFSIVGLEDETTDPLNKWCGHAVLALAGDYLRRFNQRVIGLPAYPHKDLCWVAGDKSERRSIAYRPSADLIPINIPDVATAARFGLADRVAQLVADGADVAQTDMFGFDALRWAVVRDYRPILDLLIAAGGKPDFCAALEAAVAFARVEAIATLAGRCASQERRLRLLIQAMNNGSDPSPFLLYISGGSEPAVRALLEAQPAPSLSGSKEVASALLATRLDFARLVLDRAAAEPSRVGEWWDGLLARALAGWRLDLVELLLERGARPGPEAVSYAVERKAPAAVRLLRRYGADINRGRPQPPYAVRTDVMPDPLGRVLPPAPRADVRRPDPPIFLALDPLMDLKMVDLLLQLGADPNVRDSSGRTPLMVAITESRIYGRRNGVGWIEWYVPQQLIEGQEGWAHRGVEPVLALLARGADVSLADKDGMTALHHAARSDYSIEIAEILLRHGADINARDASERTPLDRARGAKLKRMPEFLEAAGANGGSR